MTTKECPKCKHAMKLEKPQLPETGGAHFVAESRWICTNEKCGHTFIAEDR